jgi:hypothetical protein
MRFCNYDILITGGKIRRNFRMIREVEPRVDNIVASVGVNPERIKELGIKAGPKSTITVRVPDLSWGKFVGICEEIGVDRNTYIQSCVITLLDSYYDIITNMSKYNPKDWLEITTWVNSIEEEYSKLSETAVDTPPHSFRLSAGVITLLDSFSSFLGHPRTLFIRYFVVKVVQLAEQYPLQLWGGVPAVQDQGFLELEQAILSQLDPEKTVQAGKNCDKERYLATLPNDALVLLRNKAKTWGFPTMNSYIVELILDDLAKRGYSVVR